ncbi:sigma 54 modulation/S30EA ribosomal C-terminal domain-containing protein [Nocardia abscessus]|uniref:sigma 54 modulation/S30EA ribosomal C-terminal domain-containing protein n=2 Tax=Nocardia abscessus TaxID=120957 RepID=UPI0024554C46|nr:sigma 54 modulation/S30EA ribosomal C-terminal domain-containing protein [Nocardia abscessus]
MLAWECERIDLEGGAIQMVTSELRFAAEHWTTAADPEVAVSTCGDVGAIDVTRAVRAIGRVLRRHHLDASARVRLTAPPDAERPTVVQVDVRTPDLVIRVQVTGPRGFAVTFAAERLDRRLARLAAGQPRTWPDPARPPLAWVGEPRPIVRRKQVGLATCTPADAVAVLDAMDYEAHLFIDADSGEDAVVHWAAPGVRLIRQWATYPPIRSPEMVQGTPPIVVDAEPAACLDSAEAANVLCRKGLPFLFCTDSDSGRGGLLYRRHDGDLALVAPV